MPVWFLVWVWGTMLAAAGAAAVVVCRRCRSERLDARTAVLAWGAFFAVEIVSFVLLRRRPMHSFGLMHLAYVGLVVGLPLVSIVFLLVRGTGAPTAAARAILAAGFLAGATGLWATFVEPYRLQTERADVPLAAARAGRGEVRIGVLSDLQCVHVGDAERAAFRRLEAERPDVILFPGDVFQDSDEAFDRELPALRALFAGIDPPGGAFLVVGDVDSEERLRRLVEGTRVRLLLDEVAETRVGDRRVRILGLTTHYADRTDAVLADFERGGGADDVRILLAHHPDPVLLLAPQTRIDLVVAGHTHGGQVVIPGFGPPFTLTRVPRAAAAGGLSDLGGRRIWISRGVGRERGFAPPLRLFCPPDVGLLTLL